MVVTVNGLRIHNAVPHVVEVYSREQGCAATLLLQMEEKTAAFLAQYLNQRTAAPCHARVSVTLHMISYSYKQCTCTCTHSSIKIVHANLMKCFENCRVTSMQKRYSIYLKKSLKENVSPQKCDRIEFLFCTNLSQQLREWWQSSVLGKLKFQPLTLMHTYMYMY